MAVVSLFSASGAPGVTVTSLGLALAWQRHVMLVDADASGSSSVLAGYLQGQTVHDRGLLDLAVANRVGNLGSAIATVSMPLPGSSVQFVPGIRSFQQAASVAPLWEPLSGVLRGMEQRGVDVVVDAGRIGLENAALPIVRSADLSLLVVRSDLPAVAGARAWAHSLHEQLTAVGSAHQLGVLLVGPGRPYSSREIRSVLGLPVVAEIPWDPQAAHVYYAGATPKKNFASGPLNRSLRTAVSSAQGLISTNRERLGTQRTKEGTHP
ncbi:MinD/ParA family ATP-binding protein [Janibacter sp. GS2]|uniref:MinD/ParA family ATP-binding protein n=1 Tax=Janibacter sp. GS2 TaxID=3442646 RepID=UPI003EBE6A1D